MWEAYFPNAHIYGMDIVDPSAHDTDRITTYIADQGDRNHLQGFIDAHGSEFDIVIDDGGHTMEQQQTSFGLLFPHVRPGGLYVIEDVHTSFPELYPGYGVEDGGANSTFAMIESFARTGKFESRYITDQELDYVTRQVAHCLYSRRANGLHSDFFLCEKKAAAAPASEPDGPPRDG
jgi:demethylmacrocin O-methyltransferase